MILGPGSGALAPSLPGRWALCTADSLCHGMRWTLGFAGSSRALLSLDGEDEVEGPIPLKKHLPSKVPGTAERQFPTLRPSASIWWPLSSIHGADTPTVFLRQGSPWQTLPGASSAGVWEFKRKDLALRDKQGAMASQAPHFPAV